MHTLEDFLPESAEIFVKSWLKDFPGKIRVTKSRKTKLGDYRKKQDGTVSISVNGDLPPHYFFFILTHEIAHHKTTVQIPVVKESPHGPAWRRHFSAMLEESLPVYPADLQHILSVFIKKPRALAGRSCPVYAYFFPEENTQPRLEQLLEHSKFLFRGKTYEIIEKRRTRYLCRCTENGKRYLFSSWAAVNPL